MSPGSKRRRDAAVVVAVSAAALYGGLRLLAAREPRVTGWPGVDESVVQRFAEGSGAPHVAFSLDWVEGDVILFAFLCAGLCAGFLLGYFGRMLFGEPERRSDGAR